MRYLILGAGGVGGSIAGFLANAGDDVSVLVRGATYETIKRDGLTLKSGLLGEKTYKNVKALTVDEIKDKWDVIFVCVKQYSNGDIVEAIRRGADENTLIIPVQNGFGNGDALAENVEKGIVLDGAIYIAAYIEAPGVVVQKGELFKVVFGLRSSEAGSAELAKRCMELQEKLRASKVIGKYSEDIVRDTMQKFTFISTLAATGLFFDTSAGGIRDVPEQWEFFIETNREILRIAEAMKIKFEVDVLEKNIENINKLDASITTSLQKDLEAGRSTEFDEIITEVTRLGKKHGIQTPLFQKVVDKFERAK